MGNKKSYFGEFGGQYVPETVMTALFELEKAYEELKDDKEFHENFEYLLKNYVGRETPLYYAKNLSDHYNQDIYLKREDLNHTGAHKINNALEYSPTILDVNSRVEVGDRKNKGLVEEIINLIGGDIFE